MTPDWSAAKRLFNAALDVVPAERDAFVQRSCGSDSALRAEVASLLAAHERRPGFIEQPALDAAPRLAERLATLADESAAGRRLGPFRITSRVGHGGMGTVYRAVRADAQPAREVAVKVIRAPDGLADATRTRELARRFLAERHTLAALDHPNITRFIDAGTSDDGAPYLVMEFVDGRPITQYCADQNLSTVAKLRLFQKVCSAVHYAHQHLVIHRDLKPANILVTHAGEPKLLDFGIAKLLDPDSSRVGFDATVTAHAPLTPAYASPEQVRGGSISTASDVYSLGIVLFETLTGRRPFALEGHTRDEALRIVCEQEPDKPSTLVSRGDGRTGPDRAASRLRRELAGDLDMIVLMALRKEPQRRYASAQQFAQDIQRHLDGLPVIARRDTLAYRSAKFVRRHRAGVSAAAVALLSLVAAMILSARFAQQAARERDAARLAQESEHAQRKTAETLRARADADALTARRAQEFLIQLFDANDPFVTLSGWRRLGDLPAGELLERGAARVEQELADQPAVAASLMDSLGQIFVNLGDYERARQFLERALEARRKLGAAAADQDVAASQLHLAECLIARGAYEAAERLVADALETFRRLAPDGDVRVAKCLDALGRLHSEAGRLEQAEHLEREALEIYRREYGEGHPFYAGILGNLAGTLQRRGRGPDAEELQRSCLAVLRKAYGDDHPDVATTLNNLAVIVESRGDYGTAESLYREALEIRTRLFGENHPAVIQSMGNLAGAMGNHADRQGAEALYRRTLDAARQVLGPDHPTTLQTLNNLGQFLFSRGDYRAAEPLFIESLDRQRASGAETSPDLAGCLHNLAAVRAALGNVESAEALYAEALAMRRTLLGEHPVVAETLNNLAALRYQAGALEAAETLLREALAIRERVLGVEHPDTATTLDNLGGVLRDRAQFAPAEELLRRARAVRVAVLPSGHPAIAASNHNLGLLLVLTGRAVEAEPLLREALQVRRESMLPHHWLTANTASVLGECLTSRGAFEEARPLLLDAYADIQAARGDADLRCRQALARVVRHFEAVGDVAAAEEYRARLQANSP